MTLTERICGFVSLAIPALLFAGFHNWVCCAFFACGAMVAAGGIAEGGIAEGGDDDL